MVGGTGLYFNALTRGLAAVPPIPADIREAVRARLASDGVAALHAELKWRDPAAAARLMPGDRARITRALEVVLATGRSLLDWHEQNKPAEPRPGARHQDLSCAGSRRSAAADRCAVRRHDGGRRAGGSADAGGAQARARLAGDEGARRALARSSPRAARSRSIEAVEEAKRDTRQYTKRQATWFRNQLPDFAWVEPERALTAIEAQLRGPQN